MIKLIFNENFIQYNNLIIGNLKNSNTKLVRS